ncbi:MAG: NAD(P)H-dependent oxidoreductase [Acidobacteria bacterium]|nr:NAD(P)H-dependent oxidoreductase [Acidobacteriota bacterium]
MGIRFVATAGSVRPGNFTSKALALAVDEIRKREVEIEVIDLSRVHLSLPGLPPAEGALRIRRLISDATGAILATPEYHGSYSSVIKLFIENLGFPSVLAGKPVALLGVAAGQIGAVKALEHLRGVCSHVGAIVLPAVVSVAGVQKLFDESGRCLDPATEKNIRGLATSMLDYVHNNVCARVAMEEFVRSGSTEWMKHWADSPGGNRPSRPA